jgi:hypothetical protein
MARARRSLSSLVRRSTLQSMASARYRSISSRETFPKPPHDSQPRRTQVPDGSCTRRSPFASPYSLAHAGQGTSGTSGEVGTSGRYWSEGATIGSLPRATGGATPTGEFRAGEFRDLRLKNPSNIELAAVRQWHWNRSSQTATSRSSAARRRGCRNGLESRWFVARNDRAERERPSMETRDRLQVGQMRRPCQRDFSSRRLAAG